MILRAVDINGWYTVDVDKTVSGNERVPVVCFEFNNLSEETKYPIPNETVFSMSIDDAKELHAWLGAVLNGS